MNDLEYRFKRCTDTEFIFNEIIFYCKNPFEEIKCISKTNKDMI